MANQFSETQLRTLAIIPKISASLSVVGSSYIAIRVFTNRRRRSKVHHRLLGTMSAFDVLSSLAYFLSTWPMPAASPFPFSAGTMQTCTAQGFFVQLGHTVLIYNACLAVYYLLAVRSSFSGAIVLGRSAERTMHFVAIFWPNVGGLLAATDGSINIAGPVACWLQSVPPGCSGESCQRGANAAIYRYVFAVFPVLASLAVATVAWICQYMIIRSRRRENRSKQSASSLNTEQTASCRRHSAATAAALDRTASVMERLVTRQAALYLVTVYFTWGIPLALRWYQTISGKLHFGLLVFFATVMPLQGIFNCLIYIRPTTSGSKRGEGSANARRRGDDLSRQHKEEQDPEPRAASPLDQFRDNNALPTPSRSASNVSTASDSAHSFVGAEDCIDGLNEAYNRMLLS